MTAPDGKTWLERVFFRSAGFVPLSAVVSAQALNIDVKTAGAEVDLHSSAIVKDALDALDHAPRLLLEFPRQIINGALLGAAAVKELELPDERRARIRQISALIYPRLRTINPAFPAANLCASKRLLVELPDVVANKMDLSANLGARVSISQLLDLPFVRSGIDIGLLKRREYESFLREAEVLKGLPADRCTLLAVFRHIPIELISDLSFLADKNIIVYRVSVEFRRTRTRVHDMAAVLDASSREIHLVSHRTRCRSAVLN